MTSTRKIERKKEREKKKKEREVLASEVRCGFA